MSRGSTLVVDQLEFEADEYAKYVLEKHWDGTPPINSYLIARILGLEVVEKELDPDIAGRLTKHDGRPARMYVNSSQAYYRRRFTVAHEIGHYMRNREFDIEYVNYRNETSKLGTDSDERFANAFAAALLMPKSALDAYRDLKMDSTQLCKVFEVSREAMSNRRRRLYP
jgi:Zn-dependent peptidase ImmA (M78 family)